MNKRNTALVAVIVLALLAGVLVSTVGAADVWTHVRNLWVDTQMHSLGPVVVDNGMYINAPTAQATTTPALMVNGAGVGNPLEVRKAGTPILQVDGSGNVTSSGAWSGVCGSQYVQAATAIATATPALFVNSNSNKPNLFEARAASTPMFVVGNTGNISAVGNASVTGGITGGAAGFTAPTAVGTATPAVIIDSSGVSNLLSVRKNATPVFQVGGDGTVTGKTLRYATAGTQLICGTATVTDTATVATGLTTCLYPGATLGQAATGDAALVDAACSSGNIVIHVKNSALTPAANAAGAIVNWCAVGTP